MEKPSLHTEQEAVWYNDAADDDHGGGGGDDDDDTRWFKYDRDKL
jgi:hypothetical protein